MRSTPFICLCSLMMMSFWSMGQKGTVRGTVVDEKGEPLFSANVVIKGTQNGTTTDFDGKFEIKAEAGVYALDISFLGYQPLTISEVKINTGDVAAMGVVGLEPSNNELSEVVVTSEQVRNTEVAMLNIRQKSANVMDGVSAQTFKKIGDSDAAAAVTRVPGVSIQGGKYVFVRGLGDRYTKTTLNGLDIPGLDPDRNSLQMDIFPTNIISNITILKTFTADLPADFVGGLVNIETKEFPESPEFSVSAGAGYNPSMHFNPNYLTQDKSATDFLGFDNGYRDEPLGMGADNPSPVDYPVSVASNTTAQNQKFNNTLSAQRATSFMNYGLGVSGGNQYRTGDKTYGFNAALSYKNSTDFYEDFEQNYWFKHRTDKSQYDLNLNKSFEGPLSVNNVLVSGLLGGALKTGNSKYKVNLMHLQNGETRSGYLYSEQVLENSLFLYRDALEYSERSISNALISGTHNFDSGDFIVEWSLSPTYSQIQDKDVRITSYRYEPTTGAFTFEPSEADAPKRIWRDLGEVNLANRLDFTRNHDLFDRGAKLKFGAGYTHKARDFEILNYNLEARHRGSLPYSGNADELMTDRFLYNSTRDTGVFYNGSFQPNNTFSGAQSTLSAYASEEFKLSNRWRAIAGLRMEKYDQYYTGQNQDGTVVFDNEKVLDLLDLFPTANLIWQVSDNANVRASYYKTTARPSFKEKSSAEITDAITSRTFIGNLDLVETQIQNADLRYEVFLERGQMLSVSAFYKHFAQPIELVSFAADPDSYQPRNVGDGQVLGLEMEARKDMGFLGAFYEKLSLNANLTLVDARVQYDQSESGEYQGKLNGLRTGEELSDYRDMQGQAPYIVNAGLSYTDVRSGLDAGIFYNVQGRTLTIVGINNNPNIYLVPFHNLKMNLNKKFGKHGQYRLGVGIANLLGERREEVAVSYKADERVFHAYSPGRTISLNFSYNIR